MKNTVKERLIDFITFLGISKNEFEKRCGLTPRYLSNLTKAPGAAKLALIAQAFPELNMEWLMTDKGEMLIDRANQEGLPSYTALTVLPCHKCPSLEELLEKEGMRKPILPTEITYRPDIDIFAYINSAPNLERSRIIVLDLPIDLWHTVRDDSLLPEAKRGDALALSAYPAGMEDPIPGALHAVDTLTNGIIVRKLRRCEEGYLATAPNSALYPDMVIPSKNIIRIFRIVFLGRMA